MTRFTAYFFKVSLSVGQPFVDGVGIVTAFAAPHGGVKFGGNSAWGALSFGKLVRRAIKIIFNVDSAGVENEVFQSFIFATLKVDGVINGGVTINAVNYPFSVNVPRPRQVFLFG